MKSILTLLFGLFTFMVSAQQIRLSPQAKISVITCGPGDELYAAFGHNAFRVEDRSLAIDQAYNYGTFDFNTPDFYTKFARGKLLYQLSSYPFHYFLREYIQDNRWVKEEVLDLSDEEKQAFFDFLQNNAKPENRSYLYDFFFDNCATKLPEVAHKILGDSIQLNYDFARDKAYTFRDLLHMYLVKKPWEKFGIDLALGAVIDRKATPQEYLFLPDYVDKAFEKGALNTNPLVSETKMLFSSTETTAKSSLLSPLNIFSILAVMVLFITYRDHTRHKRSKWLDLLIFIITGITGLVILFLWFATDHTATAKNYNALWAFAPNLLLAFAVLKDNLPSWFRYYLLTLLFLLLLTVVLWVLNVQVFPLAIIPVLLFLAVRYGYLYKAGYKKHSL